MGDVFVTNPLPGSPHIITMDFLMHRAPCIISLSTRRLRCKISQTERIVQRQQFNIQLNPSLVGGAISLQMTVGGAPLTIIIDTGAPGALSVGPDALLKIKKCTMKNAHTVRQVGVHGEEVCSQVFYAHVSIGTGRNAIVHPDVQVFANDMKVQGADGYAGMGLLRSFDIWLEPGAVGLRASGLAVLGLPTGAGPHACSTDTTAEVRKVCSAPAKLNGAQMTRPQ